MSTSQKYPVSDIEYDIMITLSNLLQGTESIDKYIRDAEQAGDSDTAKAFNSIRDGYVEGAKMMRETLVRVLGQSGGR